MNQPTRGRLKRSNFIQHSRILERKNPELLDHMSEPIPAVKTIQSWKRRQLSRIFTKVPEVADRGCQPEPERKSLTLEYINTKYPEGQWTHAYTDSSAAVAARDGGGGCTSGTMVDRHTSKWPQENILPTLKQKLKLTKSRSWDQTQPTPNQAQCGHLHRCSLCPQQTPKSPPERSQRGGNCPGGPCSPVKPNPAVDSSTLQDQRKWTSRQACSRRRPAGPKEQIHLTPMKRPSSKPSPWKDGSSNTQTSTSQTTSTDWTDQSRLFCSTWELGTTELMPNVQQVQGWWVWDVPVQCRHHDCRTSATALPITWCSEVGHVARTKTT